MTTLRTFVMGVTLSLSSVALAAPGEGSFTPTSLLVPLYGVRLDNSATHQSAHLYHCPADVGGSGPGDSDAGAMNGTDDDGGVPNAASDCLVDMADNSALTELFAQGADIRIGTYDQVVIDTCAPGGTGYVTLVKGSVELDGNVYYTSQAGGGVLSADIADLDYVPLEHAGCSAAVPLSTPLLVQEGQEVTVSAFFSLRNITWATLTGNGPPGGCAFNGDHSQSVCTGYPIPVAFLGDAVPTLETYHITEDLSDLAGSKAGGQVLLLRDGNGSAFGGFTRRLYSATSANPTVNFDTPIKLVTANDDGSYLVENYGGGSAGMSIPFYVRFPAFRLEDHDGAMVRADGMPDVPYRAVKQ